MCAVLMRMVIPLCCMDCGWEGAKGGGFCGHTLYTLRERHPSSQALINHQCVFVMMIKKSCKTLETLRKNSQKKVIDEPQQVLICFHFFGFSSSFSCTVARRLFLEHALAR